MQPQHTLEECLLQNADVSELWEGRIGKKALREAYASWLEEFAPWMVFVTLTFREDMYRDMALRIFDKLVRLLNQDVYGKNYKRFLKHSYFSYVLAKEYQSRGVIHYHFLADRPLNFKLLHAFWNVHAGYADTQIIKDSTKAVRYVVKYMVKNGDPEIWKATCDRQPLVFPHWWKQGDSGEARGQVPV